MGDITSRPDIPVLSPVNETTVSGLFIAGELGGLSLIRNAIGQGRMVVEEIARRKVYIAKGDILDVIIVGAGPAGLSAALTAIENNLSYLVIDDKPIGGTIAHYPRKKLVMTQPVEIPLFGWLKEEEYSKETLVETWETIVEQFQVKIRTGERVESVRQSDGMFEIVTNAKSHFSRFVVLAMGRRGTPRKLEVPGEDLSKVMYQLIDARSYTGKHLLVVGGGDSAVEAAVGLARQRDNVVSISYRKSAFLRVKKKNEDAIVKMIQSNQVRPLFDSEVVEVKPTSVALKTKDGPIELPNDYVIVQVGGIPPFEMLRNMGIQFGGDQKPIESVSRV
jgi:putative YpdA family bacillithiol system oxidoreductase